MKPRPLPGMAAHHNDSRGLESARESRLLPSPGEQAAFLAYQTALFNAYHPYHDLSATQRTLTDIFSQYPRYELDPRLGPPPLPLPPGFSSFGLPSPLLYGAGAPTYLPGASGSPMLTPGLPSPYYHRIYDLEKESKPDCSLPADLSTKRRDGIKSENQPMESCSHGKKSTKSKTKVKVPKLETVKLEEEQRDDVNNNQGRENLPQGRENLPQSETVSESMNCDRSVQKCQNDPNVALNLVKKDYRAAGTSHVIKTDQSEAVQETGNSASQIGRTSQSESESSDVRKQSKRGMEESAAVVYSRHDVTKPDIPHTTLRHQPRDEIVMFPLVRSLSRDPPVTSSPSQPTKSSFSFTSSNPGPITAQDASAASAALSLPPKDTDWSSKRVHAPTFTPEITIPVSASSSPKISPSTSSTTSSPSPSPNTKRVYAATFTPEVAANITGAVRPIKRAMSQSEAKTIISQDKKRTLSSSQDRKTPEKRRWFNKEGPSEKKSRNDSIWGSRAPTSPKVQTTPVNRKEAGKIRLAVDWKAAILGTPRSKETDLKNSDNTKKSDSEKPESEEKPKEKTEEKTIELGCVKNELKMGGCLKDEKPLSKAASGHIPVGIAVARQRVDKTKQEQKPSQVQQPSQLDLSNKAMTSSLVSRDVKQEITAGVLVTGGAGLVNPWSRDSSSATSSWFQTTNQQSVQPTYWLGHAPFLSPPIMNNLDLTSSLHAPPMNAVVAPSTGGYKLAQDPLTGQLFVIPSTNIDVLDTNRLWTTVTGPLQSSLAPAQMITNQMATNPPALNLTTQSEQPLDLQQHDTQMTTKPSPDDTPAATPLPPPPCTLEPGQLSQPFSSSHNFTFANLPFYYDTNVQAEVATLAPKTEPVAMQSRGTSPMTVASGSPFPESDEPEAEVDIAHVETDKHNILTQNTAIQTSPDMDQMNEMREQSSQTSEPEKECHSDHADSNAEDAADDSEPDTRMSENDQEQVEINEPTSQTGSGSCVRRRHSDLQSLIRELMPLANAASAEKLTVPLSVQVDHDRLYENSYRNLHSNLSTPGTTPSRRWSELAEHYQDEGEMDGLDLLSTIVDKHSDEFRSPDSRQPSGSPRDRLSVGSWDRCVWSEDLASPDTLRTHHSPHRTDPLSSTCSSPTFGSPSKSTWAGHGSLTAATNLDNMDASEIEMRLKLAELQRKYREKQRLLAKLQPKRHSDNSSDKPRHRASHSSADEWKKPRKRIKKRRHSTPSTLNKHDRRKQLHPGHTGHPGHTAHPSLGAVTDELFLKPPQMKGRGLAPVTVDTGLSLLANAAAASSSPTQVVPESSKVPGSPGKRKPTSPRKLCSPTKALSPTRRASLSSKQSPRAGSATKRRSAESRESDDEEKKRTKSLLDEVWTIRRSERIFLSECVAPSTPKPETKPVTPISKPKPKVRIESEKRVRTKVEELLAVKREVISPEPEVVAPEPEVVATEPEVISPEPEVISPEPEVIIPEPIEECDEEAEEMSEEPEGTESTDCLKETEVVEKESESLVTQPDSEKDGNTEQKDETTEKNENTENTEQKDESTEQEKENTEREDGPPECEEKTEITEERDVPDFHRSTSAETNDSTESENLPLIKLVVPKKTIPPAMKPVILEDRDLVDGLRILLFMEELFYPAMLKPIQPPDIYGVTVIGGRGSNRPRIMTQEELLREAIFDTAPVSKENLGEGARVCAYWSQKFRCLYPGTVAGPESDEENDLTELEKEMIFVEFDDGDSGRIPFDHIRMLPEDFPEIGANTVKYPLLSCEMKPRPPTPPPPSPEPEVIAPLPEPEKKVVESTVNESEKPLEKKPKKKKKSKEHDEKDPRKEDGDKKKKKKKKKENDDSLEKKEHKHKHKKKDKDRKDRKEKEQKEKKRPSTETEKKEKQERKEKRIEAKKKNLVKVENEDKKEDKTEDTSEETDEHDVEAEGQSRMAAFLPAQQLWRWSGKGNKRYGVKGKVRKTLYKAIVRDGEEIKVGDCAVFMSTGRPHLPYVGRIDCFWESWSGAMCVRVKWFYHPEETKTSKKLVDMQGALYQTAHRDDNDVQTISHKCDVLPLAEYLKSEREDDSNDLYYLAGNYDPVGGAIEYEPGVE